MFGAISIGRVFGITLRIHTLWLVLLIAVALFWPSEPLSMVLYLLLMFALVVLHELGHSLMARSFGIRVIDITLWPLGGMARMSEIPESPKIETLIAIAGPAVNLMLAMLVALPWILFQAFDGSEAWPQFAGPFLRFAHVFVSINLLLGCFNLLPAFPMDGGRVLRSILALFSDWLTATRRAVAIGKVFAALLIGLGLALTLFGLSEALVLPLVGAFLWITGTTELLNVRRRHGDVPGTAARTASYRVEAPLSAERTSEDPSGARKPGDNPLDGAKGPLSRDDIARLESYRGRLRPPSDPSE